MTEKENVATYARIRPYNPAINEDRRLTARAVDDTAIMLKNSGREDTYNFTKVFDMQKNTNDVFEQAMKPLLQYKILQGINSIFMVYGQSGSGKSFTLIGEPGNLGLLSLSLSYLLDKDDIIRKIDIASIEAYGVKAAKIGFYDLVSQLKIKKNMDIANKKVKKKQKKKKKAKKRFKRNQKTKSFDPFATKHNPVLSVASAKFIEITKDNCYNLISELQEVSHMAPTLKNPHSSRGHTVYFCRITMRAMEDVYFIAADLAGSEGQTALGTQREFVSGLELAMRKGKLRLGRTGGGIFKKMYKTRSLEAGCINNGLTNLQAMFGELIKRKLSKSRGLGLRKILSSFISLASAYVVMFTLSASANNTKITKATLNFAKQTQLVKVDTQKAKPKIDKDAIIKELNFLIEKLKQETDQKDKTIKDLKQQIKNGTFSYNFSHSSSNTLNDDDFNFDIDVDDNKDDNDGGNSNVVAILSKMNLLTEQMAAAEIEEAKWNVSIDDIQTNNVNEDELKKIFVEFDADGGGTISPDELHIALTKIGKNMTMDEINQMVEDVDANGDGEIDFDEFKVMVGQQWFIDTFQSKLVNKVEKFMATSMNVDPSVSVSVLLDDDDDNDNKYDNDDLNSATQKLINNIKYKYERKLKIYKANYKKQFNQLKAKNKKLKSDMITLQNKMLIREEKENVLNSNGAIKSLSNGYAKYEKGNIIRLHNLHSNKNNIDDIAASILDDDTISIHLNDILADNKSNRKRRSKSAITRKEMKENELEIAQIKRKLHELKTNIKNNKENKPIGSKKIKNKSMSRVKYKKKQKNIPQKKRKNNKKNIPHKNPKKLKNQKKHQKHKKPQKHQKQQKHQNPQKHKKHKKPKNQSKDIHKDKDKNKEKEKENKTRKKKKKIQKKKKKDKDKDKNDKMFKIADIAKTNLGKLQFIYSKLSDINSPSNKRIELIRKCFEIISNENMNKETITFAINGFKKTYLIQMKDKNQIIHNILYDILSSIILNYSKYFKISIINYFLKYLMNNIDHKQSSSLIMKSIKHIIETFAISNDKKLIMILNKFILTSINAKNQNIKIKGWNLVYITLKTKLKHNNNKISKNVIISIENGLKIGLNSSEKQIQAQAFLILNLLFNCNNIDDVSHHSYANKLYTKMSNSAHKLYKKEYKNDIKHRKYKPKKKHHKDQSKIKRKDKDNSLKIEIFAQSILTNIVTNIYQNKIKHHNNNDTTCTTIEMFAQNILANIVTNIGNHKINKHRKYKPKKKHHHKHKHKRIYDIDDVKWNKNIVKIDDFGVEHIVYLIKTYILIKLNNKILNENVNVIINYFIQNQLNGTKIKLLSSATFNEHIMKCLNTQNDKSINEACIELHSSIINYDVNNLIEIQSK